MLNVFDVNGKIIHEDIIQNNSKVDVSTWSKGMYHLTINSNEHCYHSYFVRN